MSRVNLHYFFRALSIAGAVLICAACSQQDKNTHEAAAIDRQESRPESGELKWARAALERNPELRVEAVDEAKQTIRVRVKATGEIATVTPGELAAIPISDLVALTNTPRVAHEEPATPPPHVTEEPAAPEPTPPPPPAPTASDYKIVRQGDRVFISGPGVNIESSANNPSSSESLKKRDEPIICEGRRTLFLDRRRMNVEGDAIVARNGCELHLTNSEITATGTGVIIQDATVHIGNSTVQGGDASLDMGSTARLFLQNSQFVGISRRDAQAKITDQGGNTWR
jgi:hypothetical protein